MSRAVTKVDGAIERFVREFCTRKGHYIDCSSCDYYECHLNFFSINVPKEVQKKFVECIAKVFDVPVDKIAVFNAGEFYQMELARHFGLTPVVVQSGWRGLVPHENIGTFKLKEVMLEVQQSRVESSEEELPLRLRGYVEFARALADYLHLRTKIKVADKSENQYDPQNDTVYLMKDTLRSLTSIVLSTIAHELAHALGYKLFGSAPDISENFEKALTEVAGAGMEFILNFYDYVKRAFNGGFAAVHTLESIKTRLAEALVPIIEKIWKELNIETVIGARPVAYEVAYRLVESEHDPPAYIVALLGVSEWDVRVWHRDTRPLSDYSEMTYKDYMFNVKREAESRGETLFESVKEKLPNPVIVALVYNPKKDTYELVKAWGVKL